MAALCVDELTITKLMNKSQEDNTTESYFQPLNRTLASLNAFN